MSRSSGRAMPTRSALSSKRARGRDGRSTRPFPRQRRHTRARALAQAACLGSPGARHVRSRATHSVRLGGRPPKVAPSWTPPDRTSDVRKSRSVANQPPTLAQRGGATHNWPTLPARSGRRPMPGDRGKHTYTLPAATNAGWTSGSLVRITRCAFSHLLHLPRHARVEARVHTPTTLHAPC